MKVCPFDDQRHCVPFDERPVQITEHCALVRVAQYLGAMWTDEQIGKLGHVGAALAHVVSKINHARRG